ncbi:ribosome silencing factor [Methylobacterium isbiliense]|uniref:ribosome silencing factor n=1 Tax=Methylobacterium isbiliense TaxID=315478 RepID=UPI003F499AD8
MPPRTVLKARPLRPYLDGMAPLGADQQGSALNQLSSREALVHELPARPEADAPAAEDLRSVALGCLADMKAEDTVEIDLVGKTSIADAMIITSGRSQRHVGSIADKLLQELKAKGFGNARVEGLPACDWVLIDAGDLLVHIFRPEVRHFYNLEKMWGADRPGDRLAG